MNPDQMRGVLLLVVEVVIAIATVVVAVTEVASSNERIAVKD